MWPLGAPTTYILLLWTYLFVNKPLKTEIKLYMYENFLLKCLIMLKTFGFGSTINTNIKCNSTGISVLSWSRGSPSTTRRRPRQPPPASNRIPGPSIVKCRQAKEYDTATLQQCIYSIRYFLRFLRFDRLFVSGCMFIVDACFKTKRLMRVF